jgi:hypothetical protein
MIKTTPKIAAAAIAGTVASLMPRLAHACAMCGLSPGDGAGHAFNTSVLFMLSGPYVTFGLIGGLVFLAYRRKVRNDRKSAQVSALKP